MPSDTPLSDFIQSLPKTETHLHLEGALPLELLQRVRPEFVRPPASWSPDFKFTDFAHFERELLDMVFSWYISPERYHEAAKIIFGRHVAQNVKYVETSFASGVIEFLGLDGREVLAAIRAAVPAGLEVRIFMGIHHNGAGPNMLPVLEDALGWKELAGVDLHGKAFRSNPGRRPTGRRPDAPANTPRPMPGSSWARISSGRSWTTLNPSASNTACGRSRILPSCLNSSGVASPWMSARSAITS
jgi:hypothetical protein